jgi:geranylgeranyl reductase family protein
LTQIYDVTVVGAGPAGATLAYELAKKGIAVLLLEKEKLPRYKCCAGGITARTTRLLDFDISEAVEDVVYQVTLSYNFAKSYTAQHPQPLIYTVMRDSFDRLLVRKAQQSGAVLIDGQKVKQLRTNAAGVEISTTDRLFHSRILAGADGARSIVAREAGMTRNMKYLAALESEVTVPDEELAKWKSRVEIDLGCIPGGYAWVFPKQKHLSIGAGCLASEAKDLQRRYAAFLSSLPISSCTVSRTGSHMIPVCGRRAVVWHDRTLLLGDAAGLADPMTGEGIYHAIKSARLAAPVIEDYLLGRANGLQDYQRLIDRQVISELRIAYTLSRIFVRFPHLVFRLLKPYGRLWNAYCSLARGELNYTTMAEKLGAFRGIFALLARI